MPPGTHPIKWPETKHLVQSQKQWQSCKLCPQLPILCVCGEICKLANRMYGTLALCEALCQGQGTLQQPAAAAAARQGCQHEPYRFWHPSVNHEALWLLTNKAQSAGRLSHKYFSFKPAFPSTKMQGYVGVGEGKISSEGSHDQNIYNEKAAFH